MKHWKHVLLGVLVAGSWVVAGAIGVGPLPAAAQTQSWTYQECFFGHQESVDINNVGKVEEPEQDRLILIPSGWTIVSGGGYEDGGVILFCR
jgi:hypothetical protein